MYCSTQFSNLASSYQVFACWSKGLLHRYINVDNNSLLGFMAITNGSQNARYFFSFLMKSVFTQINPYICPLSQAYHLYQYQKLTTLNLYLKIVFINSHQQWSKYLAVIWRFWCSKCHTSLLCSASEVVMYCAAFSIYLYKSYYYMSAALAVKNKVYPLRSS